MRIHILELWQTLIWKIPPWCEWRDISLLLWETERSTIAHWFCRWLVKRLSGIMVFLGPYLVTYLWYNLKQRWKPTAISRFLGAFPQTDIMQDALTYHLQNQRTMLDLSVSQCSGQISLHSIQSGTFNKFTHSRIIRRTRWHFSDRLKQIKNARSNSKDMDLDSSSTLSMLLSVQTPFNKGVIPLSPINISFSHFLLCLPTSI